MSLGSPPGCLARFVRFFSGSTFLFYYLNHCKMFSLLQSDINDSFAQKGTFTAQRVTLSWLKEASTLSTRLDNESIAITTSACNLLSTMKNFSSLRCESQRKKNKINHVSVLHTWVLQLIKCWSNKRERLCCALTISHRTGIHLERRNKRDN